MIQFALLMLLTTAYIFGKKRATYQQNRPAALPGWVVFLILIFIIGSLLFQKQLIDGLDKRYSPELYNAVK